MPLIGRARGEKSSRVFLEVTIRSFINAILSFISESALTDLEFDAINTALNGVYALDATTHNAIAAVLADRESVSNSTERLKYYFMAKGVSVSTVIQGSSNIFLGSGLCN